MSFIDKIKSDFQPVCVPLEGENFYLARLSAKQKGRFDIQWGNHVDEQGTGEDLRGFLVAFCLCDESGQLCHDSGQDSKANKGFLEVVEAILNGDAGKIEPFFEAAAVANGILEDKTEKN